MQVVTVCNQKGGVGKTTTAFNLGCNLNALYNKKVLLIDLDAQSNMAFCSGVDLLNIPCSLYEVFKDKRDINDSVINLKNGLDIIVGTIDFASADRDFSGLGSEKLLQKALRDLKTEYDFIIIDTPPVLGVLIDNALIVSDKVIIPVSASVYSLQGVSQLLGTILTVQEDYNDRLTVDGLLMTKVSNQNTVAFREMKSQFQKIAERINSRLYETIIRQTIKVEESAMMQTSLLDSRPNATATQDYIEFTKEFLKSLTNNK